MQSDPLTAPSEMALSRNRSLNQPCWRCIFHPQVLTALPRLFIAKKKIGTMCLILPFSYIESSDKIILFQRGVPPSVSALWPQNQTFASDFLQFSFSDITYIVITSLPGKNQLCRQICQRIFHFYCYYCFSGHLLY